MCGVVLLVLIQSISNLCVAALPMSLFCFIPTRLKFPSFAVRLFKLSTQADRGPDQQQQQQKCRFEEINFSPMIAKLVAVIRMF